MIGEHLGGRKQLAGGQELPRTQIGHTLLAWQHQLPYLEGKG